MNNLYKSIFYLIAGMLTIIYASWLLFGWEGARVALFIFLIISGLNCFLLGIMNLYDFIKDKDK